MSKSFPKDCTTECPYFKCWDLSADNLTFYCSLLQMQIDECDLDKLYFLPDCPINNND